MPFLLFIEMEPSCFSIPHSTFITGASFKMYLVSRTATFAKLFFLLGLCGLIMYSVLGVYTFHVAFTSVTRAERTQLHFKGHPLPEDPKFYHGLKYILLWTIPELKYDSIENGQRTFIDNDCAHLNCFLTTNKTLLNDVKKFDAVVFSIVTLRHWNKYLPKERSAKQKYVFYSMIPANVFPVCNIKADGFFNWTWTYKLYSEISTPFIEVKDLKGNVVAPSMDMEWPDLPRKYNSSKTVAKSKAIMWEISNCDNVKAIKFAKDLKLYLKEHSLDFDIYGCGNKKCPEEGCLKAIEKYSFYLAIEDAFTNDYVTNEVLKGLRHNAVPVVVGGADYNNFLPPGSYIDARYEPPERLAGLIGYIIRNPSSYNNFFSWKNDYTINAASIEKGYCQLCALLNDQTQMERHSSYESFRKWWYYGSLQDKCYPKGAENMNDVLSFIDDPSLKKRYGVMSL